MIVAGCCIDRTEERNDAKWNCQQCKQISGYQTILRKPLQRRSASEFELPSGLQTLPHLPTTLQSLSYLYLFASWAIADFVSIFEGPQHPLQTCLIYWRLLWPHPVVISALDFRRWRWDEVRFFHLILFTILRICAEVLHATASTQKLNCLSSKADGTEAESQESTCHEMLSYYFVSPSSLHIRLGLSGNPPTISQKDHLQWETTAFKSTPLLSTPISSMFRLTY